MNHIRHSDLYDAKDLSATLIGAGGIGAAAALVLAKMGLGCLTIWDGDLVDEVNIATQFHRLSDIGRAKVAGVSDMLNEFADGIVIEPIQRRIGGNEPLADTIVISAVDSIQARKDIWQAVRAGRVRWYIDSRMAAEEFHLYLVDMLADRSWYEQMLAEEDDSKVPDMACTAKATIFTAAIAAGHIGSAVKAIAIREKFPRILIHNIRRTSLTVIE